MNYTASQVKELRDKTGAGMMDVKNALVEADGDMGKATELLRQKGLSTAAKKSGRQTAEGLVHAALSSDGQSGILIEVNCETDFVAKGDDFLALVNNLTQQALTKKPTDVSDFLTQPSECLPGKTVSDYMTEQIGTIKENMSIRRLSHYTVAGTGLVHSYIHTGGKIGVLLELSFTNATMGSKPEVQQLAKDLCMQIASVAAEFVKIGDIPASVVEAEKRIEMGKDDLQNKPEEIRAKIVDGRVQKLMAQRVLVEQAFIKDPGKTIGTLLEELSASLGDTFTVSQFQRYVLGEGIEKKEENFAEEVMAQLK